MLRDSRDPPCLDLDAQPVDAAHVAMLPERAKTQRELTAQTLSEFLENTRLTTDCKSAFSRESPILVIEPEEQSDTKPKSPSASNNSKKRSK